VRLKQIIGNLLHNAQKFTNEGGIAELTVYREDENAVICVKDNGIGIKEEMLPIVFEPFTQAENSLDRSNGGLGLGLSIVRSIAQLHGGSATALSEGLGRGSSVLIHLPLLDKEENGEEIHHPYNGDVCPLKILLIENNRDYADLLRSMLEKEGHLCISADDGIQGMEKARELSPDAVFCDIGLPVINGFEVARRLRSEPSLKNIFLIALTGYAGQRDVQTALEAGFHMHLSKPADLVTIRNALREAFLRRLNM
jgi:CheY-like chemotaxis protein